MTSLEFKHNFLQKHGGMERCDTSPMTDYGTYVKTYFTTDGHQLTEVNGPDYRPVKWYSENGDTKTELEKCWCTEIWTTENAASIKWYEKY